MDVEILSSVILISWMKNNFLLSKISYVPCGKKAMTNKWSKLLKLVIHSTYDNSFFNVATRLCCGTSSFYFAVKWFQCNCECFPLFFEMDRFYKNKKSCYEISKTMNSELRFFQFVEGSVKLNVRSRTHSLSAISNLVYSMTYLYLLN